MSIFKVTGSKLAYAITFISGGLLGGTASVMLDRHLSPYPLTSISKEIDLSKHDLDRNNSIGGAREVLSVFSHFDKDKDGKLSDPESQSIEGWLNNFNGTWHTNVIKTKRNLNETLNQVMSDPERKINP